MKLALLIALLVPAVSAQSLPDWASPSATTEVDERGEAPVVRGRNVPRAMPPPPPGGGGAPVGVPLDGGLTLLALAGGAYAARRLRQS